MTQSALRLPAFVARSSFFEIPGSDAYGELVHLLRDAPRFFHRRFERHGRVFKTRLVFPVVFLIGEQANKTMLVTERHDFSFGRGYQQTSVDRVFEGSIMLQDGAAHRRTRDILSPAVGRLAVRESAEKVFEIWSAHAEGLRYRPAIDVYELSEHGTFDVSANALTGLDLGPETESMRGLFERLIGGIMAPTKHRIPFGRMDRALRARARLHELLAPKVLAARRAESRGLVGQLAHHRDERGQPLPVHEIVGHLLLLFWASYDTTASAGAWLFHMLAQRPDWQERLRAELAAWDGAELASIGRSKQLPQLEWFLREIERMYPSALFFPRIAVEDFEIDGYTIPAGTPTFYSPYMSHRDPRSFASPNVFDPSRWDEARPDRARLGSLFGFGGGPRVCLGKSFAKLQLKLATHAVLSRFRLEPDPTCTPSVTGLPVHHPTGSRVRAVPI